MSTFLLIIFFGLNSLSAFNLSSGRWDAEAAEVLFSSTMGADNAQELKNGQWINEFKTAFSRWTDTAGVKFTLTYSSEDCGNNCTISNNKNEMYWIEPGVEPVNMPAGALAVTLRRQYDSNLLEVDIVINKNFDSTLTLGHQSSASGLCILSNGTYSNCFDFPSVITHEIGHFFGLDHSSEDSGLPLTDPRRLATMYYSLAADGSLIPLKTDDEAGISCVYPTEGEPYKVALCCQSYNPFDRAPGCSHAFSNDSTQSLDVGGNTSGCGYIENKDEGNNSPPMFLVAVLPLLALFACKILLGRRKRT